MKCIFLDFDGVINNWNHFDGVAIENALILKKCGYFECKDCCDHKQ